MDDKSSTIDQFLTAVAAKQPTPGGGAVAAVAGALAASIGEMVINYSIGKKGLEEHAPEFAQAIASLARIRAMLLELMVEDQAAFENLTRARKLPAETPDRERAIRSAIDLCVRVPETIGATAVEILDLCHQLVDKVNRYLLSDLAVCADLAMATVRCALHNVRVNLNDVPDPDQKWRIQATSAHILSRGLMRIQAVAPRVWQRLGEPAR